jgi:hypothetical protein
VERPNIARAGKFKNLSKFCDIKSYIIISKNAGGFIEMSEEITVNPLCEDCGQPLFLDKEECQAFIEGKLKEGYIVCSCCSFKQNSKE